VVKGVALVGNCGSVAGGSAWVKRLRERRHTAAGISRGGSVDWSLEDIEREIEKG
jgi:hypothetical protein